MVITDIFIPGILIILILLFMILLKKEYHLYIILLLLLVVVSDVNENLRLAINFTAFLYLLTDFLLKNQLFISKYPKLPKELSVFIALYFMSLLISTAFSVNLQRSFVQVSRVTAFFILIYLIYCSISTQQTIKYLYSIIVISSAIVSLVIIYNFAVEGIGFDISANLLMRTHGIYSNVNAMGGMMVISFMILISLLISRYNKKYNKYIIMILVLDIMGLVFNNSRSTMIGIIFGCLTVLFLFNRKYFYIFLSVIGVLVIIILFDEQFSRIFSFYFRIERGITGRDNFWNMAIRMFEDNLIFGIGPGGYKFQMYKYLPVMIGSWHELTIYKYYDVADIGLQHNIYLFIISELGICGLLVFLVFLIFYFRKSVKLFRSSEKTLKIIGLVGISAGAGLLVRGIFESLNILTYGWISGDLPFWIIVLSLFSVERLLPKKLNY